MKQMQIVFAIVALTGCIVVPLAMTPRDPVALPNADIMQATIQHAPPVEDLLAEGLWLGASQSWQSAASIAARDGDRSMAAKAINNIGGMHLEHGDLEAAAAQFLLALAANPDDVETWVNLGSVRLLQSRRSPMVAGRQILRAAAIEHYRCAIEARPNFAAAWTNLGVAYADDGNREQAVAALERAVWLDPRAAGAQRNLEALR